MTTMTKMEIDELQKRAKGMSREEQMVVLSSIPFEVVWEYSVQKVNSISSKLTGIIKNASQLIKEEEE